MSSIILAVFTAATKLIQCLLPANAITNVQPHAVIDRYQQLRNSSNVAVNLCCLCSRIDDVLFATLAAAFQLARQLFRNVTASGAVGDIECVREYSKPFGNDLSSLAYRTFGCIPNTNTFSHGVIQKTRCHKFVANASFHTL